MLCLSVDRASTERNYYASAARRCVETIIHISGSHKQRRSFHEGRKDYECNKCEKKFGQKPHLLLHKKTVHEGRKDYKCDRCEKKFGMDLYKNFIPTTEDYRCRQNAKVHEGREDIAFKDFKNYLCDSCGKKFGNKSSFHLHQKKIHEGCRDFACNECEKKFGLKTDLLRHQRSVHEGRKDYPCDKFEKKFGHKTRLITHQKTAHEGRKDYECDNCEQKFVEKSKLISHQKTVHESRKDYECDNCTKKFTQKSNLLLHKKSVHEGRKDYGCDRKNLENFLTPSKCRIFYDKSNVHVFTFHLRPTTSPYHACSCRHSLRAENKLSREGYCFGLQIYQKKHYRAGCRRIPNIEIKYFIVIIRNSGKDENNDKFEIGYASGRYATRTTPQAADRRLHARHRQSLGFSLRKLLRIFLGRVRVVFEPSKSPGYRQDIRYFENKINTWRVYEAWTTVNHQKRTSRRQEPDRPYQPDRKNSNSYVAPERFVREAARARRTGHVMRVDRRPSAHSRVDHEQERTSSFSLRVISCRVSLGTCEEEKTHFESTQSYERRWQGIGRPPCRNTLPEFKLIYK
ncbi:unnamed protein product [Trichogramma brassicae]|uniref:C2H2-type domain-containing protein n=1 Tax=Trichogramma brassicae TaxID=86971 RepID=A0A6H5ICM0_9HYME|nr:unnamed protein product [Trichogramma brassicae]